MRLAADTLGIWSLPHAAAACVKKSELDENWASLYQQRRAGNIVTTSDLLSFAYQIANGMEFLHSKEVVHRDLALRNILLTFHYIVKIGDFGLSRQTISGSYQKCHNPLLPVKWTAPEVFVHNTIPIESDLYTFGILLWELFTLGGTPHEQFIFIQEVEEKEQNVVVKKGKRMNKPSFAPREIYELIKVLCNFDPYLRPPLKQCKRKIVTSLKEACPLLAVHLDVADASEKSDKTNQSHEASSMKIPQRKGEFLPQSLANDDNNIPIPKEKQSSCITQKYRRNIILISAVVFFTFAAISVAIVFLSKRSNSAGTQNNNNFNVTSTVISTDGSTSAASETSASINTVTTSLLITSVNQQKSEPTSAKSPTTPKPTTTSTVPQNSQSPANSTCRNLDLLFLIDESQSMHISDGFWAAKSFILNVTDTYDFFPNSRFAWIIFNSKLWMLTPFMNAQDFKDNVTNTDFNEGSTNFVLGFNATNYTISIYSGPSKQRQPVVIFVSDGNPNDGGSLNQVIAYTAYLRCNLNTLIIGLGVSETLTDAQTMKDAIGVGAQDGCIASHYGDISNYAQIPVAGLPQVEQDLQCRPTKSE
uniref:Protein kinase domain-containing protein n=1 Tax=Plectus sambesii TaxID=2011161 RepID=A0A914UQW6_9BILA